MVVMRGLSKKFAKSKERAEKGEHRKNKKGTKLNSFETKENIDGYFSWRKLMYDKK